MENNKKWIQAVQLNLGIAAPKLFQMDINSNVPLSQCVRAQ